MDAADKEIERLVAAEVEASSTPEALADYEAALKREEARVASRRKLLDELAQADVGAAASREATRKHLQAQLRDLAQRAAAGLELLDAAGRLEALLASRPAHIDADAKMSAKFAMRNLAERIENGWDGVAEPSIVDAVPFRLALARLGSGDALCAYASARERATSERLASLAPSVAASIGRAAGLAPLSERENGEASAAGVIAACYLAAEEDGCDEAKQHVKRVTLAFQARLRDLELRAAALSAASQPA